MPRKNAPAPPPAQAAGLDALQLREKVNDAFGSTPHELRRDGRSPLLINGRKLAEATSYAPGTSLWYEVAAYVGSGGYVAAIKVYKKSQHEKDIHLAESFPQLAELLGFLEGYDPTHDVSISDDLTDKRLSTAEAMVRAAALRQRMAEARSEYRAAAGEILTELSQIVGKTTAAHP